MTRSPLQMHPDSYTNSFRTRVRFLFSPLRLTLFIAAIIFAVAANVLYIGNGGQPEWLGLASVIPLFALLAWQMVLDTEMRRRDRDGGDRDGAEE